ncbi:MAG: hypothetical protein V7K53_32070 [Nostoc sp.]|uniref:hypothetical protein n=1 Tax=Nostoc sp. TaxID=1180 RepID=UPI002FF8A05E
MTINIFAKTANDENLQAPVLEELDDSQVSAVVGGKGHNDHNEKSLLQIVIGIGIGI